MAAGNEKALSIAEGFFKCEIYEEYRTYLEDLAAFRELP